MQDVFISTYKLFGIEGDSPLYLVLFLFLLSIYPRFRGHSFIERWIPELSDRQTSVVKYVGPVLCILSALGLPPVWTNPEVIDQNIPRCWLQYGWREDGSYLINWMVTPSDGVIVKVDGFVENNSDSKSAAFDPENNFEHHHLAAENRWGACSDDVLIDKNDTLSPYKLQCHLWASKAHAQPGELYELHWWIEYPYDVEMEINDAPVERSGKARVAFTGPQYDRFYLVAKGSVTSCEKQLSIESYP